MLKTAEPKKGGDEIGGGSKTGRAGSEMDNVEVDGDEVEVDKIGKKVRNFSKSKNLSKSKKIVGSDFLTPKAKLAFTELR